MFYNFATRDKILERFCSDAQNKPKDISKNAVQNSKVTTPRGGSRGNS